MCSFLAMDLWSADSDVLSVVMGRTCRSKRFEELYNKLCDSLGVLASRRLSHEEFFGSALYHRDNDSFVILPDDSVHLPVAEAFFFASTAAGHSSMLTRALIV